MSSGYRIKSVNIIPKNIISQIKGYHNVEYIKNKIATINGEIEMHRKLQSHVSSNNKNPMEINIRLHSTRDDWRNYEINYTITELECLAIIDSLDKFHCYLHGSHFTVHTDHNALVCLKISKIPRVDFLDGL
ncbi:hypothetical protein TNCV_4875511 [Trichonephila clavipes]|nr:hypothetical protein TNCV_4875511 [Trichonephila clavipes]